MKKKENSKRANSKKYAAVESVCTVCTLNKKKSGRFQLAATAAKVDFRIIFCSDKKKKKESIQHSVSFIHLREKFMELVVGVTIIQYTNIV